MPCGEAACARASVCPANRMCAATCHREQTAGPKSASFCMHLHFDIVSSSVDFFIQICQRP